MRAVASGNSVQVFLEPDLLRGVGHLQRGQPAQVRRGPGALAGVRDAVALQQGLEAVARVAALAHRVLACTHQVAHGFVGGVRHAHGSELTGARQAGQQDRVAPVGPFDKLRTGLTRSPERLGIDEGATTSQCSPCALRWRQTTNPQGPASQTMCSGAPRLMSLRSALSSAARSPPMLPTWRTSPSRPASASAMSMLSK